MSPVKHVLANNTVWLHSVGFHLQAQRNVSKIKVDILELICVFPFLTSNAMKQQC